MRKQRLLLLLFFFLIQSFQVKASHIMGGEITWECQNNGRYIFTLKVYRDCQGYSLGRNNNELEIHNYPANGTKSSFNVSFKKVTDISPACLAQPCSGSPTDGSIEEYIFESNPIKLTGVPPASGWPITWTNSARNAAISNIKSASTYGMTLRAIMYPFQGRDAFPCFDSSPDFFQKPSSIICSGEEFIYNHNVYDKELDSIAYSWAKPLNGSSSGKIPGIFNRGVVPSVISYDTANGYRYNSPFPDTTQDSRNISATLNNKNGEITFTSYSSGSYVSVIRVQAYKCGELVAEVFRELQTVILPGCSPNKAPEIPPPFSNGTYYDTVKAGNLVNFDFNVYDTSRNGNPNNDTLYLSAFGQQFGDNYTDVNNGCTNPPCATLSQSLPDTSVGTYSSTFNWQTSCNHIAQNNQVCITDKNTYIFTIKAFDNFCPAAGMRVATFAITVLADSIMDHPEIYCADVQANGAVNLNWEKTKDPDSSFKKWMIYSSQNKNGPYNLIDSIADYDSTSYTDINSGADKQSIHYLIRAKSACHDDWKVKAPDTISTIHLSTSFNGSCVEVSWNSPSSPLPNSSKSKYKLFREYPIGTGFNLYKTLDTTSTFICDTFNICTDSVAYKVELENKMGCSSASNRGGIEFTYPPPIANAGKDQIICKGQSIQIGGGSNPKLEYAWFPKSTLNDSSLVQPLASPIDTTKYYLSVSDSLGCTAKDSLIVNVKPSPEAIPGKDTSLCVGAFPLQLYGNVSVSNSGRWIGGSGTFSPNRNTLNATYMPSSAEIAAGTITLSLISTNNGSCDQDTADFNIQVLKFKANINLNVYPVSCIGSSDASASIAANGANGPYQFTWNSGGGQQSGDSISNLSAGNYSVIATNKYGCDSTINFSLSDPQKLNSSLSIIKSISCNGYSDGEITVNATGGRKPYSYQWSNNQTSKTITGLKAGRYRLTLTDSTQCSDSLSIKLSEPDSLLSSISNYQNITCNGKKDGKATVVARGGTTPYQYQWSNNDSTNSTSNLSPGTYTVTVTDSNACSSTSSLVITQPAPLNITNISKNDESCFNEGDGSASASVKGGTVPYSFYWSNSANSASIQNLSSGKYNLTVLDSNNCDVSDSVIINAPSQFKSTIKGKDISCVGRKDGMAEVIASGGTTPYQYQWSNNNKLNKIINLSNGRYKVTVTDDHGCTDTNSYKVKAPDSLQLIVSNDDTICMNTPKSISASAQGGVAPYNYTWSDNMGNNPIITVNPRKSKTYTVSVTDANNCPKKIKDISITVKDIESEMLKISAKDSICINDTAIIRTSFNGKFGPYNYQWNKALNGIQDHAVSPQSTTEYILKITDLCNNSISDSLNIVVNPLPSINLVDTLIEGCKDLTVKFSNKTPDNYKYQWDFGDGNYSTTSEPTHTYTKAGLYDVKLKLRNAENCPNNSTQKYQVKVNPSPVAEIFAEPKTTTIKNPNISFRGNFGDAQSWNWILGEGTDTSNVNNFTISYPDTGTYTTQLIEIGSNGCSDTAYLDVVINPFYTIKIPNAFSPNPNGPIGGSYNAEDPSNEVFFPFLNYAKEYNMRIFNRWGELIFESNDVDVGWDGYYKGKLSPSDVYIYKINVTFLNGKKATKVGDVTLLR